MGKLNVGAPNDLDGIYNSVGMFLKAFLQFRINGQHGRCAVGITGMHAHGIDVLDETDGDLLAFGVPHYFEL